MLGLVIPLLLVSYSSAACPAGWFAGGPHCFYVNNGGEVNWGEAETLCNLHGGALATFEDLQTLQDVSHHIGHGDKKLWVGGTDDLSEGTWTWLPSGNVININVHDNDIEKDCLTIDRGHHNNFYADDCSSKNPYMCELPNASGTGNPAPVG